MSNTSNIKELLSNTMDYKYGSWIISDEDMENIFNIPNGEITDGDHSFNELYTHRMILFSIICNNNPYAWKSWKHADGTMYDDYFIVGIGDENGFFSYHYHKDYWNMFNVWERDFAPKWSEDVDVKIEGLVEFLDGIERNRCR